MRTRPRSPGRTISWSNFAPVKRNLQFKKLRENSGPTGRLSPRPMIAILHQTKANFARTPIATATLNEIFPSLALVEPKIGPKLWKITVLMSKRKPAQQQQQLGGKKQKISGAWNQVLIKTESESQARTIRLPGRALISIKNLIQKRVLRSSCSWPRLEAN